MLNLLYIINMHAIISTYTVNSVRSTSKRFVHKNALICVHQYLLLSSFKNQYGNTIVIFKTFFSYWFMSEKHLHFWMTTYYDSHRVPFQTPFSTKFHMKLPPTLCLKYHFRGTKCHIKCPIK